MFPTINRKTQEEMSPILQTTSPISKQFDSIRKLLRFSKVTNFHSTAIEPPPRVTSFKSHTPERLGIVENAVERTVELFATEIMVLDGIRVLLQGHMNVQSSDLLFGKQTPVQRSACSRKSPTQKSKSISRKFKPSFLPSCPNFCVDMAGECEQM